MDRSADWTLAVGGGLSNRPPWVEGSPERLGSGHIVEYPEYASGGWPTGFEASRRVQRPDFPMGLYRSPILLAVSG
jgi:hypothetical protein